MDFKVSGNAERLEIAASGELTGTNGQELRDTVLELVDRTPQTICLDLGGVTFIDSPGLGVLIGLRSHLRKRSIEFTLANPQPRVYQVLRLTQMHKIFGME